MKRFTAIPIEPTSVGRYYLAQDGIVGWQVSPLGLAAGSSRTLADWMNDAEQRIVELEAELTEAHGELAAVEVERRGWQRSRETMRRLLALVEEWERADCFSSTYACAEQVRAILRGDAPMGWESREGGDNA